MKKLLLLGMAMGLATALWSQGVGGGLLVAGVASQIDGDAWSGYNKFGYSIGGFAWYDFNERLSLMPEITINRRGSRDVNGSGQYNMNLIDVPVLLRYKIFSSQQGQSVLAEAGPSANILFGAKSGYGLLKLDLMDKFNHFGVSANAGATIYLSKNIGVFGRWTYSLTNLNRDARLNRAYWRCYFITFGAKIAFK
jgi:hypothetical protein